LVFNTSLELRIYLLEQVEDDRNYDEERGAHGEGLRAIGERPWMMSGDGHAAEEDGADDQ